jgi:hypothetical protein
MEMENNEQQNSLQEDKDLVEGLFSKEALMQFEENQMQSSASFFENQQATILKAVGKKKAATLMIGQWGKLAIAASLLAMVATAYIFMKEDPQSSSTVQYVKIEEIPSDEIENYVNNNELIAEIDWASEINEEAEIFEEANLNNTTNKDTNKTE